MDVRCVFLVNADVSVTNISRASAELPGGLTLARRTMFISTFSAVCSLRQARPAQRLTLALQQEMDIVDIIGILTLHQKVGLWLNKVFRGQQPAP